MVMVQFSFNSQPPTKGTAIDNISLTPSIVMVSILSPQQRGLQYGIRSSTQGCRGFQFSAPNKGDCNSYSRYIVVW